MYQQVQQQVQHCEETTKGETKEAKKAKKQYPTTMMKERKQEQGRGQELGEQRRRKKTAGPQKGGDKTGTAGSPDCSNLARCSASSNVCFQERISEI